MQPIDQLVKMPRLRAWKILWVAVATVAFFLTSDFALPQSAAAYPFWAQETAPLTPPGSDGTDCLCQLSLSGKIYGN